MKRKAVSTIHVAHTFVQLCHIYLSKKYGKTVDKEWMLEIPILSTNKIVKILFTYRYNVKMMIMITMKSQMLTPVCLLMSHFMVVRIWKTE